MERESGSPSLVGCHAQSVGWATDISEVRVIWLQYTHRKEWALGLLCSPGQGF